MPSLKTIRKRIASVKNTQKITKAMKMVAAAKLRRAQQAALNSRHYVDAVQGTAGRLIASQIDQEHPLLCKEGVGGGREGRGKKDFLILTSDRGLCGGFNSNLLRKIEEELEKSGEKRIECRIIGKKGKDYFKAKNLQAAESATGLYEHIEWKMAEELAKVALHRFESKKTDEVWIVFNFFKSMMVQEVRFKKLLPVEMERKKGEETKPAPIDYIYEPNAAVVLDTVLRNAVTASIYSALLESHASELAARMAAMDNATNNASDMISYLTLVFNRARQAAITKELMDIVGGAEALR